MIPDLIYDVGLHRAEDTRFYLAKGFRVVAVEAAPALVIQAQREFASEIDRGELRVVAGAIAAEPGPITFYLNETTEWNTADPQWAADRARLRAAETSTVTVEGIRFADVLAEHGVPYFLKVDIEGADLLCIEALSRSDLPRFVSIESSKTSWSALVREFELLLELGYRRFKVVPQHKVPEQIPPRPAREGRYVQWQFDHMSSGLFGEEAPGRWLTARQAIAVYRGIFARYRLWGDNGVAPHRVRWRMARVFGQAGWYDTHAAR